jgi:hypothetical protein
MNYIYWKKKILSSVAYKIVFVSADIKNYLDVNISVIEGTSLPMVVVIGNNLNVNALIEALPSEFIQINTNYQLVVNALVEILNSVNIVANVSYNLNVNANVELLETNNFEVLMQTVLNIAVKIVNDISIQVKPKPLVNKLNVNAFVLANIYHLIIVSLDEHLNIEVNGVAANSNTLSLALIGNLDGDLQMLIRSVLTLSATILNELDIYANMNTLSSYELKVGFDNYGNLQATLRSATSLKMRADMPIINKLNAIVKLKTYKLLSEHDSKLLQNIDNLSLSELDYRII